MVSSIGSVAGSLLQQFHELQSSLPEMKTGSSLSFEELIGNETVSNGEQAQSEGITSTGCFSCSEAESNSSKSEMDLNHDGNITIEEIMQYTSMQMMEQMQEHLASDEGSNRMQDEGSQQEKDSKFDLNTFKTQMAAQAYQTGENLLNASIGSVTQSFAL